MPRLSALELQTVRATLAQKELELHANREMQRHCRVELCARNRELQETRAVLLPLEPACEQLSLALTGPCSCPLQIAQLAYQHMNTVLQASVVTERRIRVEQCERYQSLRDRRAEAQTSITKT